MNENTEMPLHHGPDVVTSSSDSSDGSVREAGKVIDVLWAIPWAKPDYDSDFPLSDGETFLLYLGKDARFQITFAQEQRSISEFLEKYPIRFGREPDMALAVIYHPFNIYGLMDKARNMPDDTLLRATARTLDSLMSSLEDLVAEQRAGPPSVDQAVRTTDSFLKYYFSDSYAPGVEKRAIVVSPHVGEDGSYDAPRLSRMLDKYEGSLIAVPSSSAYLRRKDGEALRSSDGRSILFNPGRIISSLSAIYPYLDDAALWGAGKPLLYER